jgi:hypothetical protein
MNINKINKESLQLAYYENKDYLIPFVAIGVSIVLFFIFILPQLVSFPAKKQSVDLENEKLNKIKETEQIIVSQDNDELDSNLKLVTKTLPVTKSFEEILNGISTAAALSGTQIENYQFQNLDVSGTTPSKYLKIDFRVTILGDARETTPFIKELYKTFPVSEVTGIQSDLGDSTISISLFYKPFPIVEGESRNLLKALTIEQSKVLNEIKNWNESNTGEIIFEENASSSARTSGSPF